MDTYLQAALAAMTLIEELLPIIGDRVKSGTVTAAAQAELLNKFESLKARANGEFEGPHWKIEPDPTSSPPDTSPL